MTKMNIKKLSIAGVFCAVAVVGSLFSFPVFGSKCAPVQHMINILCAVLLGPGYGVGVAFGASLIRNLLGLGSLMAFPGSMFGALLCQILLQQAFRKSFRNACWRSIWHSNPWRTVCVSYGNSFYGTKCIRSCFLCLYCSVFNFYCWWSGYFCSSALQLEKIECSAYHAGICLITGRKKYA